MRTASFIILATCGYITALGQTTAPRAADSSAVRIITKVPFNGMNYFITIVPIDSTNIDNMPIVNPNSTMRPLVLWRDSLQMMLPDSILKLLPSREDFLRPRKPGK